MRHVLILISAVLAAVGNGCSEPNCAPNEIKVADECYARKHHSDGGITGSGSEEGVFDGSRVPASNHSLSDSSVDRFAPPTNVGPTLDSSSARDAQGGGNRTIACSEDLCEEDGACGVDAGLSVTCWVDNDGDGYAAATAMATTACGTCPLGLTSREPRERKETDCDDAVSSTSPTATDICGDAVDNDCDGSVDEELNNACGGQCTVPLAGQPGQPCSNNLSGACARKGTYECQPDGTVRCGAPSVQPAVETCNEKDDDCDGDVDEGVTNACSKCGPVPGEVCDGTDNNCNGQTDEGSICPERQTCQAGRCTPTCGNGKIDPGEDCESGIAGWDSVMCDRSTCLQRIYQTVCTSDSDCFLGKCGGGITTRRYCIPAYPCGNGPNGLPDASECPDLPGFAETCIAPNACFVACTRDRDCPSGLICMPNAQDPSWPGYCVGE